MASTPPPQYYLSGNADDIADNKLAWIDPDYDHKFYNELGEWSIIEEPTNPLKVMIATDSDTDNVNVNANYTDVPENGVAVVIAKNKEIDLYSTPGNKNNFSFTDQIVSLYDKRGYGEYCSRIYFKGTAGIITFRDSLYSEILAWYQRQNNVVPPVGPAA